MGQKQLDVGLWASCLVFFLGAFIYYVTNNASLIYASSIVICGLCIVHAITTVFFVRLNIWALVCTQTLLWYLFPFTYSGMVDYETINTVPLGDNISSLVLVVALAGVGYWLSGLFAVIRWRPSDIEPHRLYLFTAPFLVAQAALLISGGWGFQVVLDETVYGAGSASEINMLMEVITPALGPLIGFHLGRLLRQGRFWQAWPMVVSLALQIVWWLPIGRRVMAVEIIVTVIAFFAAFYSMRLSVRRVFVFCVSGLALLPVVYLMWNLFFAFRQASYLLNASTATTISAAELMDFSKKAGDASQEFGENVLSRPFIINSVTICLDKASGLLWGTQLVTQALLSVPSFILPIKSDLLDQLGGVNERLWERKLSIPYTDYANTMLLDSYLDFGVFGFFVYLSLIGAIFLLIFRLYGAMKNTIALAYCFFSLTINLLLVEGSLSAQFALARGLLLVLAVAHVVTAVSNAGTRRSRSLSPHQREYRSHSGLGGEPRYGRD